MKLIRGLGIALVLAALGCSSSTSPSSGGHTTSISLQNTAFNPSVDTVAVGSTVTWTANDGAVTHNVTYASGPGSAFASSGISNGATYQHQFTLAGTYVIYCTIHGTPTTGMHSTVVVQ